MNENLEQRGDVHPPKADPETLVLRARPRPVVRFRRGVIIGAIAGTCLALAGVAWLALDPPDLRLAERAVEATPARPAPPDGLAGAPSSYGEVPQLGPPLPGDLGRPILEHQRSLAAQEGLPPSDRHPSETERQRRAVERQAVRASALLVQVGSVRGGVSPEANAAAPPAEGALGLSDGLSSSAPPQSSPEASRWTLSAGTIIPASLITGLNSDLPGTVLAQVTENVRDSATGRTVLVPQGARLIGKYADVAAFGQSRALVAWQRLVLPDGSSITLDDLPVSDAAGYAGLADEVDFHTWRLLKGIGLSTLLGVGTEIGLGGDEGDLVRAIRESAQQNAARAGEQIVARNLDVRPTITVRPGWPVRVIVNRDLVLKPDGA